MQIIEKWTERLQKLEALQTISSPAYTMYRIRAAEIKVIKELLTDLNQSNGKS